MHQCYGNNHTVSTEWRWVILPSAQTSLPLPYCAPLSRATTLLCLFSSSPLYFCVLTVRPSKRLWTGSLMNNLWITCHQSHLISTHFKQFPKHFQSILPSEPASQSLEGYAVGEWLFPPHRGEYKGSGRDLRSHDWWVGDSGLGCMPLKLGTVPIPLCGLETQLSSWH